METEVASKVTCAYNSQLLGRLRQEDCLNSGIKGQPEYYSKTISQKILPAFLIDQTKFFPPLRFKVLLKTKKKCILFMCVYMYAGPKQKVKLK